MRSFSLFFFLFLFYEEQALPQRGAAAVSPLFMRDIGPSSGAVSPQPLNLLNTKRAPRNDEHDIGYFGEKVLCDVKLSEQKCFSFARHLQNKDTHEENKYHVAL